MGPKSKVPTTATHAVGIVYRLRASGAEYLLVRPRNRADEWVLPKGHIEPGESPESAAVREVREEAGVRTRLIARVADGVRFQAKGEAVNASFFLLRYESDTVADEDREKAWVSFETAVDQIKFPETREVLIRAEKVRAAQPS